MLAVTYCCRALEGIADESPQHRCTTSAQLVRAQLSEAEVSVVWGSTGEGEGVHQQLQLKLFLHIHLTGHSLLHSALPLRSRLARLEAIASPRLHHRTPAMSNLSPCGANLCWTRYVLNRGKTLDEVHCVGGLHARKPYSNESWTATGQEV